MFNIDLKNIVEKDKDEVELECPKCRNGLLSYFHGTFLLAQVLSAAKRGKNAYKFKLIDGELYTYENNDWEIKEKQYPQRFSYVNVVSIQNLNMILQLTRK